MIFGNSGAGKTTYAQKLCQSEGLAHLDLDTLAWMDGDPPKRRPLCESKKDIDAFLGSNPGWAIEGCYSDLIDLVLPAASEIVFLDLPVETCIANARKRPWEPHKYESKQAQDANQYYERRDGFSRAVHQALYKGFAGRKRVFIRCGSRHEGQRRIR